MLTRRRFASNPQVPDRLDSKSIKRTTRAQVRSEFKLRVLVALASLRYVRGTRTRAGWEVASGQRANVTAIAGCDTRGRLQAEHAVAQSRFERKGDKQPGSTARRERFTMVMYWTQGDRADPGWSASRCSRRVRRPSRGWLFVRERGARVRGVVRAASGLRGALRPRPHFQLSQWAQERMPQPPQPWRWSKSAISSRTRNVPALRCAARVVISVSSAAGLSAEGSQVGASARSY